MALAKIIDAPAHIAAALRKASNATGVDFDYLMKTAERESSMRPSAKARTSSAAGLFQFIENTWLKTIKQEGSGFGLDNLAAEIKQTRSGRYTVPDRSARAEILGLRHDPEVSAMLAGAFTRQNADIISDRLGRAPSQGELYIAHFLGAEAGAKLIGLAGSEPRNRADAHFPRAAKANPSIFYNSKGPRSVAEVYRLLVSKHSSETAVASVAPQVQAPERGLRDAVPAQQVAEPGPIEPVFQARIAGSAGLGAIGAWQTIVMSDLAGSAGPGTAAQAAGSGQSNGGVAIDSESFGKMRESFFEQLRGGQG